MKVNKAGVLVAALFGITMLGCGSTTGGLADSGTQDSGASVESDAGGEPDAAQQPLGPPTYADLVFTNKSSNDLLFYVMISVMETPNNWGQIHLPAYFDNGAGQAVQVRVKANSTETIPEALTEGADQPIAVAVYVTTQGAQLPRFDGIQGCIGNALELEYDYDSALAQHVLKWRWPYDPSRSDSPNSQCDVAGTWQQLTKSVPMCTAAHASCSGSSQCCSGLCCQNECCSNGASCYFNVPGHPNGCSN